jgi:hypothetical protein
MTIASKNNFYTASLLFRSVRDGATVPELWEESLVFIRANSSEEALARAREIGYARELAYTAIDKSKVVWKFFKVERVFEVMDELIDGAEIFSRHLRNSEVESLLTPFDD